VCAVTDTPEYRRQKKSETATRRRTEGKRGTSGGLADRAGRRDISHRDTCMRDGSRGRRSTEMRKIDVSGPAASLLISRLPAANRANENRRGRCNCGFACALINTRALIKFAPPPAAPSSPPPGTRSPNENNNIARIAASCIDRRRSPAAPAKRGARLVVSSKEGTSLEDLKNAHPVKVAERRTVRENCRAFGARSVLKLRVLNVAPWAVGRSRVKFEGLGMGRGNWLNPITSIRLLLAVLTFITHRARWN